VFMMIKAQIEAKNNEWANAKATLTHAYNLPGVKEQAYGELKIHASDSLPFNNEDRVKVFILLTEVLCELKEFDEAKKILNKAVAEF